MLIFNYDKFDFWKIYDSIKHFYPIGINKDEIPRYRSHPGLKELEDILLDNTHNETHFTERWVNFTEEIGSEINKEIVDTTHGQVPCFSSYVLLETAKLNNLTRTKGLHFLVSLVGPYYTVIGEDWNTVEIDEREYRSTNYLVVSPENEFENIFRHLCSKVEARFKGFRFVPFDICRQMIEGLQVQYSDRIENSVFHALFNESIDPALERIIGNAYFKSEDWVKEGYIDGGGCTSYPPDADL